MLDLRRIISGLLLPALLLIAGIALLPYLNKSVPPTLQLILPLLPYVVFITGMLLSWIFHHSREFNLFLLAAIIFASFNRYYWFADDNDSGVLAYLLLALLIPINYFLNNILKERGILNRFGLHRFVYLGAQLYLVAFLIQEPQPTLSRYLNYSFSQHAVFHHTALTQPILLLSVLCLIYMLIKFFRQPTALMGGVLGAFVALLIAANFINQMQLSITFFLLSGIILIAAIVLNAYSLAYLDELTNLPSRRALRQSLSSLSKRYAIAMVDVDHFKKFNDKYGHDIGDQVLRMLATHLRRVRGGKAFRYGGEEFTLIFPGKDLHEARFACESLCEKVAQQPFILRSKFRPKQKPDKYLPRKQIPQKKLLKITISIGVAEKNQLIASAEEVIKFADKALYRAKKAGRNRVAF